MPSVAEQRQNFATVHAPRLAADAVGPIQPWSPEGNLKLSKVASFFGDADRLVVVAGPHPGAAQDRDADHAVAYGLAHADGRPFVAVLPANASHPTLTRAPWIKDFQVLTYDLEAVSEKSDYSSLFCCPPRAREQVLEMYGSPAYSEAQHIGDDHLDRFLKTTERARWVERLTRWAEEDPDLQAAHRQSYLAWQCRGRMVLKIAKTKGGLRVTAGVHYSGEAKPKEYPVNGLIEPAAAHRLIAAASLAAADKLEGIDKGHQEHQLQAALADDGLHEKLGVRHPRREYPAFRPTNNPGSPARAYIDFLGSDERGRLHVIETKIGNDPMLVLQGLDYWIWATANAAKLQANFQLSESPKVILDFVAAAPVSGDAIGPYSLPQAKRLAGEVERSFWEVSGWKTGNPRLDEHIPN